MVVKTSTLRESGFAIIYGRSVQSLNLDESPAVVANFREEPPPSV